MNYLIYGVFFFFISLWLEKLWIGWLRSKHIKQAQKDYGPKRALEVKGKTPAMGGIIFLAMTLPFVLAGWLSGTEALVYHLKLWTLPFMAGLIGLYDDLLKVRTKSSEGLSSLEKLFLQVMTCLIWSWWVSFPNGVELVPSLELKISSSVPLLTFLSVSMLNAVNVTDGLDGLAGGASLISIVVIALFTKTIVLPVIMAGSVIMAFLWYNAYPAKVFMGDVGSHFLGGLLVSLSVMGNGALYIVPAGALFGVEILSVLIQIVSIRGWNRKIFKMSPIHHHFELSGWSEVQIVTRFWILHILGIALLTLIGLSVYNL